MFLLYYSIALLNKMTDKTYSDEFLLHRIFSKLEETKRKKLVVEKLIIEKKNGKTFVTNFLSFCESVKRDANSVQSYIENDLQIKTSLMENGTLIINKVYPAGDIEKTFERYARSYVICAEPKCGSGNTEIIKENRINYIYCHTCKSKKSV